MAVHGREPTSRRRRIVLRLLIALALLAGLVAFLLRGGDEAPPTAVAPAVPSQVRAAPTIDVPLAPHVESKPPAAAASEPAPAAAAPLDATVTVVDGWGRPIAGATVILEPGGSRSTDGRGTCRFDLPDSAHRFTGHVSATAEGYLDSPVLPVERAGPSFALVLELHARRELHGTLRWSWGDPVANGVVRVHALEPCSLHDATAAGAAHTGGLTALVVTEADGRWRAPGLCEHGRYELIASRPGVCGIDAEPVVVDDPDKDFVLSLNLKRTGGTAIEGTVVDVLSGEPVPGAEIALESEANSLEGSVGLEVHGVADGAGAFSIEAPATANPGITYHLLAKDSGGRSGALGPLLPGVRGVDIAVGRSCDLRVQVTSADGEVRKRSVVTFIRARDPHRPFESHPASPPDQADAKHVTSNLNFEDDGGLAVIPAPGIEASWLVVSSLITGSDEGAEAFLPLGNPCRESSGETPPVRLVLQASRGDVIVQLDPCGRRTLASHVRCSGLGDDQLRTPKHEIATLAEFDLTGNEQHRLQLRAGSYLLFFDVDGVFTGSRWIVVTPGDVYPILLPVCVNGR